MKKIIFLYYFLVLNFNSYGQRGIIKVGLEGITEGQAIVNLYREGDDFPKKYFLQKIIPAKGQEAIEVTFENLAYGKYALAVIWDQNGNGKLDFYWFGMPKEPVKASRNAKGFMGPPVFEDAAFVLNSSLKNIQISFD